MKRLSHGKLLNSVDSVAESFVLLTVGDFWLQTVGGLVLPRMVGLVMANDFAQLE